MNFYIVDDDPAIPMILSQIIENNDANIVVGTQTDPLTAEADIIRLDVDIVLVDLLMPQLSGIELVKKLKHAKSKLRFVMISQVRDRDLRAEAYEAGIEFFIDKPINVIEVKTVIGKVIDNIEMTNKLKNIQSVVGGTDTNVLPEVNHRKATHQKVMAILRYLGITSETGSSDIMAITQIMIDEHLEFSQIDFESVYQIDSHEKKILFQRIRRSIRTGLTNLATLFMDSNQDEIMVEYANSLFDYKNVRDEIQYLQGTRSTEGKTSLPHFFNGLIQESEI